MKETNWMEEFEKEVEAVEKNLGPWNAHKFGEKDGHEYYTYIRPNWTGIKAFISKVAEAEHQRGVQSAIEQVNGHMKFCDIHNLSADPLVLEKALRSLIK